MPGKLIILSAPSGAGKTTIVKYLLQEIPKLEFSVSATSRPMREGESHGRDYYFLKPEEFKKRIDLGDFVEWEEVYTNQFYGTLHSELDRIWKKGNTVLFDVDVKGGINLKRIFGNFALAVFIMPPSIAELRNRLENRNTDTPENIDKRVSKAEYEITFSPKFDKIVVNDQIEKALEEVLFEVSKFLQS